MIITHHPLFFKGIKKINFDEHQGKLLRKIIKENLNVYSAHTNLDAGERGLNQILAERIGLKDIEPLDKSYTERLYKLVVYVPVSHESQVRKAINDAGAGCLGRYSDCSFKSRGTGTFTPSQGTRPFIGEQGRVEEVDEYRLETIVPQHELAKVLQSMFAAHPYEEVAYDLYLLENGGKIYSLGRTGKLEQETTLRRFCEQVKVSLGLQCLRVVGSLEKEVKTIAVVSGAGASFMDKARARHCDVLLTGDLKYHEAKEAEAMGLAIIDAGHQGTERIMSAYIANLLTETCTAQGMNIETISFNSQDCISTF